MRREPPLPTVVEVWYLNQGRLRRRWKVVWSNFDQSSNAFSSLETACHRAAQEYQAWRAWLGDLEGRDGELKDISWP